MSNQTDDILNLDDLDTYNEQVEAERGYGAGGVILYGYVTYGHKFPGKGVPAADSFIEIESTKLDNNSAPYKAARQKAVAAAQLNATGQGLVQPPPGTDRSDQALKDWKWATTPHVALGFIAENGMWYSKGAKGEGRKVIVETIDRKSVQVDEEGKPSQAQTGKWGKVKTDGELLTALSVSAAGLPIRKKAWMRVTWKSSVTDQKKDRQNPESELRAVAVLAEIYADEAAAMAAVAEAVKRAADQAETETATGTPANPFVNGFSPELVGKGWTYPAWLAARDSMKAMLTTKKIEAVAAEFGTTVESVRGLVGDLLVEGDKAVA